MSINRKLSELEAECNRFNLVLKDTRRSKPGKQDYIDLLMNHYLLQYKLEGTLTPCQDWVHEHIESPKLATAETQIKEGVLEDFYDNPDVGIQQKMDGCRILLCYDPLEGFGIYSRNRSVTDYCFGNYTDKIKGFERPLFKGAFKKSFILDCELVCTNPNIVGRMATETQLEAVVAIMALNKEDSWKVQKEYNYPVRFSVFDLLMYDWKSTMMLPYFKRDEACSKICKQLADRADEFPDIE